MQLEKVAVVVGVVAAVVGVVVVVVVGVVAVGSDRFEVGADVRGRRRRSTKED